MLSPALDLADLVLTMCRKRCRISADAATGANNVRPMAVSLSHCGSRLPGSGLSKVLAAGSRAQRATGLQLNEAAGAVGRPATLSEPAR